MHDYDCINKFISMMIVYYRELNFKAAKLMLVDAAELPVPSSSTPPDEPSVMHVAKLMLPPSLLSFAVLVPS